MRSAGNMRFAAVAAAVAVLVPLFSAAAAPSASADLRIVIPDGAGEEEKFAAEELEHHLGKATGRKVPVVGERAAGSEGRRLFVGRVKALADLGVDAAGFKSEERLVKGSGEDIYFVGGPAAGGRGGTLYAVYDFLEHEMGVRWLWPGELGEVIPRREVPVLAGVERRGVEPLVSRRLRGDLEKLKAVRANRLFGWRDPENAWREAKARRLWLTRHRCGSRETLNFGHAFTDWYLRFADRPELFARQPGGRRGSFVASAESAGRYYPLCVSNPEVHDIIVADWAKANRAALAAGRTPEALDCCENDTPGFCTCANCRAWDAPDPRFATHPYWCGRIAELTSATRSCMAVEQWGEEGEAIEGASPPSVTDRYVRFYNAVLAKARKVHPAAKVCAYAYSNYLEPPKVTRVAEGVSMSFVPSIIFPYAEKESAEYRRVWGGWNAMGATSMCYRPNYLYGGGCLPYSQARHMADDINFAFAHGMTSVDQDSLLGAWSAQALKSYVAARLLREPDAKFEKVSREFYDAFGAGADDVRRYCEMLEALNDRYSEAEWTRLGRENRAVNGVPGGGWKNFFLNVTELYSEQWFAEAEALLSAASGKTSGAERGRVEFLRKGLCASLLLYRTRVAQKGGDEAAFRAAFGKLVDYRASVEADFICAWTWFAEREAKFAGWPHKVIRIERKR